MSTFAADVQAFIDEAGVRADEAVRAISLELLNRVVTRTPVGNPELWAANQVTVETRRAVQDAAERIGKRVSRHRLEKEFPLTAGADYVGGRARGNWQVTFEAPATSAIDKIDPSGARTIAIGADVLGDAKAGKTIFLVNNLPYSERLETGWSKQAPAGIVNVTVAEFEDIVKDVAGEGA